MYIYVLMCIGSSGHEEIGITERLRIQTKFWGHLLLGLIVEVKKLKKKGGCRKKRQ